ncbi:MAG: hypothetical protein R6W73_05875 [Candidatus Saliniplasma sp.]
MDCGEYVYYTQRWVSTGSSYLSIDGWGQAYPFFPGMFVLSGTFSLTTNVSILSSTVFLPVIISSFVPLLVFLISHKITRKWKPSLISSIFLSLVAPFVYNYSQPKPETLGFFLMTVFLIFFVTLSRDSKKFYLLMIPTAVALIVTHHLTTYFTILFILGGIFFSEFVKRRSDDNNLYKFYSYLLLTTIAISFWMLYAEPFRKNRIYMALGTPSYSIIAVPYIIIFAAYVIIKLRRKSGYMLPINIHKQNIKTFLKFAVPSLIIGAVLLLLAGFYRVPGRDFKLSYQVLFYFPLLILGILAVEARKIIKVFGDGMHVVGWFLFGSLSMTLGILTEDSSLLPMRQLSFLLLPLSILLGLGITQIFILYNPFKKKRKKVVMVILISILLLWSVPLTYPTQESVSGYEEGSDWDDLEAGIWSRNIDGKIATDHRMSAVLFGVGNENLTWIEGYDIYFSQDPSDIRGELDEFNVSYILWDQEMLNGVTTKPGMTPYSFDESTRNYYGMNHYSIYLTEECQTYKV